MHCRTKIKKTKSPTLDPTDSLACTILHVFLDDDFLCLIITAWSDKAARIRVWSSTRVNTWVNTGVDVWVSTGVDVWVKTRVIIWVSIRDIVRVCIRVYIRLRARVNTRVYIKFDTRICAWVNTRVGVNRCVACCFPAVILLQFNGWETANSAEVFVWVVYKRHAGQKKEEMRDMSMICNWSVDG